ncbi:MAG: J domain-containing protein [Lautropia sp.]
MDHLDHYQVLGVAQEATPEQIRVAYRQAAQACHPDRAGNTPQNIARFQQLTAAYKVLRYPALRQAYDAELGIGGSWKPCYGPIDAVDGYDGLDDTARRMAIEGFERVALVLASGGFGAPRIAARLALSGCSYRTAWQIAWRARHQIVQDELDRMFMQERDAQRAAMAQAVPGSRDAEVLRSSFDGPAAMAFAAASPSNATGAGAGTAGAPASSSRALAVARPVWRASRPGRLQRLLMRIAKIIGFTPARMSRENRKLLRLEYRAPER